MPEGGADVERRRSEQGLQKDNERCGVGEKRGTPEGLLETKRGGKRKKSDGRNMAGLPGATGETNVRGRKEDG